MCAFCTFVAEKPEMKYKTTHIMKHANMKNTLSFVCLKNINNYKIEY